MMKQNNFGEGATLVLGEKLAALGNMNLSPEVLNAAKNRTLHALGLSLLGQSLPVVATAARTVGMQQGNCFAFGTGNRLDMGSAAFLNGVAGHASLMEDCGPGGLRLGSHPGTFIIPAALAAAEETNANGETFLRALVVGYETVARIGNAAPTSIVSRRFRPLAVMGPLGAAASAACILGANAHQMSAALAIAANLAGGSTQGIYEGTMEAFFQAGFAARNGLLAAQLAMAGADTAKFALEGEFGMFGTYGGEPGDLNSLTEELNEPGICSVGIKRFAACLQNQQTIALIVDGLDQPLQLNEIEWVIIIRPAMGTNGLNSPGVSRSGPFQNRLEAQMSARFTAAAALLGKPVNNPHFFDTSYADLSLLELTRRIELVEAEDESVTVIVGRKNQEPLKLNNMNQLLLFPDFDTLADRLRHMPLELDPGDLEELLMLISLLEKEKNLTRLTTLLEREPSTGKTS